MSSDDRLRMHPKERLGPSVQHVLLGEELQRLRAEAHKSTAGHRQVVLVKRGPVTVILFALEPESVLKEHQTEGEVTIHALSGRLEVTVGGKTVPLGAGELLSMAPGEMHAVRAVTASGMLLTVCRV